MIPRLLRAWAHEPSTSGDVFGRTESGDAGAITRVVAALVAVALAFVVPDLPRPTTVATVLVAYAVIQALLALLAPRAIDTEVVQCVVDIVTVLALVFVVPEIWPVTLAVVCATLVWLGITRSLRITGPVLVVTSAGLLVTGWQNDVPNPVASSLAVTGIGLGHAVLGRHLRRRVAATQHDLAFTLRVSGAIAHRTDLRSETPELTGGEVERLLGWTVEEWQEHVRELVHPDDVEQYWIDADEVRPGQEVHRRARFRHRDGHWVWVDEVARVEQGRDGRPVLRGLLFDITELQDANEGVRREARTDQLTGLPNRLHFDERLAACTEGGESFALLVLDIDRFKEINDALGHRSGDVVLRTIADRLASAVGQGDTLVRLGGDEFAVIAPGAHAGDRATILARSLGRAAGRPVEVDGVTVGVSISIGVTTHDASLEPEAAPYDSLQRADLAMYASKRNGRPVTMHGGEQATASVRRLALAAQLQYRTTFDVLRFALQPKFDLVTMQLSGAEALVRWHHPTYGVLAPDEFLDLIEVSTVGDDFARRTVSDGIDLIRRSGEAGPELPIAVNVASRALRDAGFAGWVDDELRRARISPSSLILEITERELEDSTGPITATLDRLADLGVRLSIDDFGTGWSSLRRLRRLPVTELKIAGEFVQGSTETSDDLEIVRSVIDLGRNLGLRTVAERVETADQLELLRDQGCDEAQGFLLGRPLPADELLRMIAEQRPPTSPSISA